MGVRVVACDESQFIVEAPVALNSNHLRTAFGGSINAVAILAGYGMVWSALRAHDAYVVIGESSIRFTRPINESIHAVCLRPSLAKWDIFQARFEETGKAHIRLRVDVTEKGEAAAVCTGIFIARSR